MTAETCHGKRTHKQPKKVGVIKATCSICEGPLESHRIGVQCYCLSCHAAYMRANRPKHSELPEPARLKANARAYAHVNLKRGKIQKQPCQVCGSDHSQMHHTDYSKPTQVLWFCRDHHLQLHKTATI
jgi:hypothetical protein